MDRDLPDRPVYATGPRRMTHMAVPRSRCLSTKVTEVEYATFESLAGDQSISEWARDVLLHARTRSATEHILLAEVLALRTILLNLHFAVSTGAPPTVESMRQLIDRADREKLQKAQERLAPASRSR
jgi:hypothetical protein